MFQFLIDDGHYRKLRELQYIQKKNHKNEKRFYVCNKKKKITKRYEQISHTKTTTITTIITTVIADESFIIQ